MNNLMLIHVKIESCRSKVREFLLIFSFSKQNFRCGKIKFHICTFNGISGFFARFDFYFNK